MFKPLLIRQLARPRGLFGWFMGRRLNRLNHHANLAVLSLLSIQESDRVLEVGFGGGLMLSHLKRSTPSGFVAGIDVSVPMVWQAQRRFGRAIAAGQMEIQQAAVEAIPYPDAWFDKACSIITIHYWADPALGLAEIHRVLAPTGFLGLALRPKPYLERIGFEQNGVTGFGDEEIRELLNAAGFVDVGIERIADQEKGALIVGARKA